MKVTCLFKGLPRFYPQALDQLERQLICSTQTKITSYSSFWLEGSDTSNHIKGKIPKLNFSQDLFDHIKSMKIFNSSIINFTSPPTHVLNHAASLYAAKYSTLIPSSSVNPYNICSSLFSFSTVFDSLESYCTNINSKPDICILLRSDLSFSTSLRILPPDVIDYVLNKNYVLLPRSGHHIGGYSDQLIIASFDNMKILSSLWRYIPTYLNQGCLFHSENLLRFHMKSNKIKVGILDLITYIYRRGKPKHSGVDGILSNSALSSYKTFNPY